MKTKVPLFLALITASLSAYSQTLFHKKINENPSLTNWKYAAPTSNGLILAGEWSNNTIYVELDNTAETKSIFSYGYESFMSLNSSFSNAKPIFTNNSSYMEIVDFKNSVLNFYSTFRHPFFGWEFGSGNKFTVNNSYFNSNNTVIKFGKKMSDFNTIVSGAFVYLNNTTQTFDSPAILALFDDNQNMLWSNFYTIDGYYILPEFIAENATEYILMGMFGIEGTGIPNSTERVFALRIDKANGQPIGNLEEYEIPSEWRITNISQNNQYLTGAFTDFLSFEPTTGLIIKLNHNSNPIFDWARKIEIEDFDFSHLNFIEEFSDGSIYFGGTVGKFNSMGGWHINDGSFYVAKANNDLTISPWSSVYSDRLPNGELTDTGMALFTKDLGNVILTAGKFSGGNGTHYMMTINKQNGFSSCKNVEVQTKFIDKPLNTSHHNVSVTTQIFADNGALILTNDDPSSHLIGDSTLICESTLGLADLNLDNNFILYPNPVKTVLNLNSPEEIITQLKIINTRGQLINLIENNGKKITIDVRTLTPGLYFIEVTTLSGRSFMKKFIKKI